MLNLKKLKVDLIKVSKKFELDFLILFGSYAKGKQRENCENESDLDFAFFKLKENEKLRFVDLYFEISKLINGDMKLNLIDLSEDNQYLLEEEIFRTGKLIFCTDKEIYYDRRNQTFFNYINYKEYDYILENSLKSCQDLVNRYSYVKDKIK
jgi:predicted nucleotidyltransferase